MSFIEWRQTEFEVRMLCKLFINTLNITVFGSFLSIELIQWWLIPSSTLIRCKLSELSRGLNLFRFPIIIQPGYGSRGMKKCNGEMQNTKIFSKIVLLNNLYSSTSWFRKIEPSWTWLNTDIKWKNCKARKKCY